MDHTGHTDYSAAQPANSQSVPEENSRNILFTVKINDQFAVNLLSRILRYLICMICIVLLTVVSGKNPGTSRIQSAFYTQQFARIPVMALSIGGRAPPKSFR